MKEKELSENIENEELDLEDGLDEDSVVTIYDEEGNPIDCDLLDFIDYEGKRYVVLLPYEDENLEETDGNVIILAIEDGEKIEEEATLESVDDEDLLRKLFEIFKEKNADYFTFEEEQ